MTTRRTREVANPFGNCVGARVRRARPGAVRARQPRDTARTVIGLLFVLASAAACGTAQAPATAVPRMAWFDYPVVSDAALRVERTGHGRSWTLTLFAFEGTEGDTVPAALWTPDGDTPAPAILLAHGMPGHRRSLEALAEAYAVAGVAVLSITAPWGRSASDLREPALLTLPSFDDRDRRELVRYVKDLRRAIDVLASNPAIDPTRIAFVGHSYGATAGAILSAVDPRPLAFVLDAGLPVLSDRFTDPDGHFMRVAGLRLSDDGLDRWRRRLAPLDATRYLGDHRAPLLLQFGRTDPLVRPELARTMAAAAGEDADVRWYDAGHTLSPQAWHDQARWLAAPLQLPLDRFKAPDLTPATGRTTDRRTAARAPRISG